MVDKWNVKLINIIELDNESTRSVWNKVEIKRGIDVSDTCSCQLLDPLLSVKVERHVSNVNFLAGRPSSICQYREWISDVNLIQLNYLYFTHTKLCS